MSLDLNPLKAVLVKIEQADIAIVESDLVPALLQVGIGALPAVDQPIANAVLVAVQPALQAALTSLLSKVVPPVTA